MTDFRKTGERGKHYDFLDARCIEAACWAPGRYQHRGATMSGSRNTGAVSACCMSRAYRGCPGEESRGYDVEIGKLRRAEGWRKA